jgi:hypothetical protein
MVSIQHRFVIVEWRSASVLFSDRAVCLFLDDDTRRSHLEARPFYFQTVQFVYFWMTTRDVSVLKPLHLTLTACGQPSTKKVVLQKWISQIRLSTCSLRRTLPDQFIFRPLDFQMCNSNFFLSEATAIIF